MSMKHDWEYKKLGEVCDILNGCAFKSERYTDEGIRIIRITNVQKGYVADDDPKFYPKNEEKNISPYLLKEGDLLMSLTGNVGRVGLLPHNFIPAALNQRVACLRIINNNVVLPYLFHLFNSNKFENEAITYSNGIAQKNMSTEWLKKYVIPIPPLPTQQSIVSELDSLSKIIADCKETLKDYDALEQSIFYDMFGDPVKNEKEWEVKKLGEVAFAQNGLVSPTEEPYCEMIHVGPANIVSGTGELINLKTAKDENLISGKYLFDKDMILYSKIRPNLNKLTIAKFQGLCSADMYPIICGELLNPYYLASVLRHKRFLSYAIENSGRANIPKINREALFQFEMHLPPLPLQQQFASKIEAIEQMKSETKKALQEAETLFQARMDYWFG